MQPTKSNYLAYIVVYFTINIMSIYLLIYFPLYFFDVLNVDRSALALTQLVSKSMLILAILMGYFFDRFSQKKKIIISISGFIMFMSFLMFILLRNILFWFGLFLSISFEKKRYINFKREFIFWSLYSYYFIQCGCSGLLLFFSLECIFFDWVDSLIPSAIPLSFDKGKKF